MSNSGYHGTLMMLCGWLISRIFAALITSPLNIEYLPNESNFHLIDPRHYKTKPRFLGQNHRKGRDYGQGQPPWGKRRLLDRIQLQTSLVIQSQDQTGSVSIHKLSLLLEDPVPLVICFLEGFNSSILPTVHFV